MCCSLSSLSLFETGYSLALASLGLAVPCLRLREIHCFHFSSAETTRALWFQSLCFNNRQVNEAACSSSSQRHFYHYFKRKKKPIIIKIRSHLSKRSSEKIVRFGTEVSTECVPVCSVSCHRLSSMYLCVGGSDWTLLGVGPHGQPLLECHPFHIFFSLWVF